MFCDLIWRECIEFLIYWRESTSIVIVVIIVIVVSIVIVVIVMVMVIVMVIVMIVIVIVNVDVVIDNEGKIHCATIVRQKRNSFINRQ